MIGRLRGQLVDIQLPQIILDINGVGYEVLVPLSAILPSVGSELLIYTHQVVREDAHFLYGFLSLREREFFRALIKVNGVGPKTALAILSSLEVDQIIAALLEADVKVLAKTPGIGKKTAERLVVEMKDRLSSLGEVRGATESISNKVRSARGPREDALQALIALGYSANEVSDLVFNLSEETPQATADELIRAALKRG